MENKTISKGNLNKSVCPDKKEPINKYFFTFFFLCIFFSGIVVAEKIELEGFEMPLSTQNINWWNANQQYIQWEQTSDASKEGSQSLKIIYNKDDAGKWAFIGAEPKTNARDFSEYKYLTLYVYGEVEILLKFEDSLHKGEKGVEIGTRKAEYPNNWTILFWDISDIPGIDETDITNILIFPNPGRTGSGEFYMDDIKLSSFVCGDGKCEPDENCEEDSCCNGTTVDLETDRNNCGRCGRKCNSSEICCAGNKVNKNTDINNCGECGRKCDPSESCEMGECIVYTPCAYQGCFDGDVYCYDSNDERGNKKEECGESGYFGDNYCRNDKDIYRNYETKGCSDGDCTSSIEEKYQKTCERGCKDGICCTIPLNPDKECGSDGNPHKVDTCGNHEEEPFIKCNLLQTCASGECQPDWFRIMVIIAIIGVIIQLIRMWRSGQSGGTEES